MIKSNIPIYKMIIDDISNKIEQGIYQPDDKLPSENQMSEIYNASVPTVRRALAELVFQKAIFRIKGKGTFVTNREQVIQGDVGLTGNTVAELGLNPQKHDARLCFLLLASRSDSSIMKMIRGAQKHLFSRGYTMSILCGEERAESEADLIQECLKSNMEGIIWFSETPEENLEGFQLLSQKQIPVVMLDRGPAQIPFTLVSAYNTDGGYQMGKHLIELGHRNIAFIADRIQLAAEVDRMKGYKMALFENDIPFDDSLVIPYRGDKLDHIMEIIKQRRITALQCVNDRVACMMIRRLEQEGYSVPQDVSVGGFDNSTEAEFSYHRMTTINQPFEEMGRTAAEKLLQLLNGKLLHSQIYLPVELIVRESTAAFKG